MTTYPHISKLLESTALPECNPTNVREFLNQHCKPWMRQFSGERRLLYRCAKRDLIDRDSGWGIVRVRQDRRPRDSGDIAHETFNDLMKEAGTVANRTNSVFTTGGLDHGRSTASTYGSLCYIVIPIGEFDFAWSDRYFDLYTSLIDLTKSNVLMTAFRRSGQYASPSMNIDRLSYALAQESSFLEVFKQRERHDYRISPKIEEKFNSVEFQSDLHRRVGRWVAHIYTLYPQLCTYQSSTDMFGTLYGDPYNDPIIQALMGPTYDSIIKSYHTTDLDAAARSTHEVMIHCDRVLMISTSEVHSDPALYKVLIGRD